MKPSIEDMRHSYTCPVGRCGAPMQVVKTLVQDGTGYKAFIVVCTKRPDLHRGFVVESVGEVIRAQRGRWGWTGDFK